MNPVVLIGRYSRVMVEIIGRLAIHPGFRPPLHPRLIRVADGDLLPSERMLMAAPVNSAWLEEAAP